MFQLVQQGSFQNTDNKIGVQGFIQKFLSGGVKIKVD